MYKHSLAAVLAVLLCIQLCACGYVQIQDEHGQSEPTVQRTDTVTEPVEKEATTTKDVPQATEEQTRPTETSVTEPMTEEPTEAPTMPQETEPDATEPMTEEPTEAPTMPQETEPDATEPSYGDIESGGNEGGWG